VTRLLPAAALAALYLACLLLAPSGALPNLPQHAPLLPPSLAHPLGTDDLGRDLLSAVWQGGRTSLTVAGIATLLALALGALVGLAAGLVRGVADEALMRSAEIVASLPTLLVAVLVAALFGGSMTALALVIGLTRWPLVARLVRIEAMALLGRMHVRAAFALGATPLGVARRHLLPHLAASIGAAAGIVFGGAIVTEAALAFVGLGDPAVTSWGQMIGTGFALFGLGWWLWMAPAAMIVLASGLVALAVLDDGQRPSAAGLAGAG
jgi:peptide/nickel transport system permease protein